METEIYYFTGTGNSLAAAKTIAEKTDGDLIPIMSLKDRPAWRSNTGAVGIVFPVYYAGPPAAVREFVGKIKMRGRPYVFAVATFGGSAGLSFHILNETARERGFGMDACFGIHMPQNAFKKPWEKPDELLARADKKAEAAAEAVLWQRKGVYGANPALELLMSVFNKPIRRASRKAVAGYARASEDLDFDKLIRLSDSAFETADGCTGCGLCERVCPADNIEMQDGRPVWRHRCENCLACAHWCPERAIRGGVINEYYYRHPDLKLKDMEAQKHI